MFPSPVVQFSLISPRISAFLCIRPFVSSNVPFEAKTINISIARQCVRFVTEIHPNLFFQY